MTPLAMLVADWLASRPVVASHEKEVWFSPVVSTRLLLTFRSYCWNVAIWFRWLYWVAPAIVSEVEVATDEGFSKES